MRLVSKGFTIVELLVVIVVIGILVAIAGFVYVGAVKDAQVSAIDSELKDWRKVFDTYKTKYGSYPQPAAANPLTSGGPGASALNVYCLGTGFPESPAGSGNEFCYVHDAGSAWRVAESTGTYLLNQFAPLGKLPTDTPKYTFDTTVVGPFLVYVAANNVQLTGVFPGGTPCPSGTTLAWQNANRVHCYIRLDYTTAS